MLAQPALLQRPGAVAKGLAALRAGFALVVLDAPSLDGCGALLAQADACVLVVDSRRTRAATRGRRWPRRGWRRAGWPGWCSITGRGRCRAGWAGNEEDGRGPPSRASPRLGASAADAAVARQHRQLDEVRRRMLAAEVQVEAVEVDVLQRLQSARQRLARVGAAAAQASTKMRASM